MGLQTLLTCGGAENDLLIWGFPAMGIPQNTVHDFSWKIPLPLFQETSIYDKPRQYSSNYAGAIVEVNNAASVKRSTKPGVFNIILRVSGKFFLKGMT